MSSKVVVDDAVSAEAVQTAAPDFLVPIFAAYLLVCLTWILSKKLAGKRWLSEELVETDNKWIDIFMVCAAAAGMFALGAAYRADWLLPDLPAGWSNLTTAINLCLPYAPIFVCLLIRRQSLKTIWVSSNALGWKLAVGLASAVVGVLVFYILRRDLQSAAGVLSESLSLHSLAHAPAVFLEAVAVAFVFVRLRWAVGTLPAILIPSLLFAAAHVPGGIESGRTLGELTVFFVFNTTLPAIIFATVMWSKDVIWIAIPHYLLDVAIEAFG